MAMLTPEETYTIYAGHPQQWGGWLSPTGHRAAQNLGGAIVVSTDDEVRDPAKPVTWSYATEPLASTGDHSAEPSAKQ